MTKSSVYSGKVMLAPMVRLGTLPLRLLALEHGADVVYTEEMIDRKIIGSERVVNGSSISIKSPSFIPSSSFVDRHNTIDYYKNGKVIFRTSPMERNRLILQLGTADPQLALQAALTVHQDVSGIDVNCGCPKHFSIHGGMGAALLKTPDLLVQILETLVQGCPGIPITCKIRIFKDRQATLDLVDRLSRTGVQAIAVHCRTPSQRPREPGDQSVFRDIVDHIGHRVAVIANGDIMSHEHAVQVMQETGVDACMIARAAQNNVTVFRKDGARLTSDEMVRVYIRKAMELDNDISNTKYCVQCMWKRLGEAGMAFSKCKSYRELCEVFGMMEEYEQVYREGAGVFDETVYDGGR